MAGEKDSVFKLKYNPENITIFDNETEQQTIKRQKQ